MSFSLSHVYLSYGPETVLEDVSFTLKSGGIYLVTGASGSGKTTLLRLLMGLEKPDRGRISGRPRCSAAFQEDRLLPGLTAAENLLFTAEKGRSLAEAENFLAEILPDEAISKIPGELSGGQCRRVAVARALFANSEAVILDEPFSGLDHGTALILRDFILRQLEGRTLILATHRPELLPQAVCLQLTAES